MLRGGRVSPNTEAFLILHDIVVPNVASMNSTALPHNDVNAERERRCLGTTRELFLSSAKTFERRTIPVRVLARLIPKRHRRREECRDNVLCLIIENEQRFADGRMCCAVDRQIPALWHQTPKLKRSGCGTQR
jgi:hypothetical protein